MPPIPDQPKAPQPPRPGLTQAERWQALLEQLRTLNAKLEYVRLMLRLGVRDL
jgi:hypothetical protein